MVQYTVEDAAEDIGMPVEVVQEAWDRAREDFANQNNQESNQEDED